MTEKYLEFSVADKAFAINAAWVKGVGVLDEPPLHVPGTPEYIAGITHKANETITMVDFRRKFASYENNEAIFLSEKHLGVIYISISGEKVGLIVDKIGFLVPEVSQSESTRIIASDDIF